MNYSLFQKLHKEGLLTEVSLQKIKDWSDKKLFSLHWEIKTILYLGVVLLSTGLGILVYKNIDTIGHQVILAIIALISAGGFFYCYKKKLPFSTAKVSSPNTAFDYILLLACLTFITFIGYIQFQYNFFGNRFGLVTFIPMIVLFISAYFFDHLGILSMAITNLAAWAGIAVTPTRILKDNDFNSSTIIVTGILIGIGLIVMGVVSKRRNFKTHFVFTYTNIGMHVLFISMLAGMFVFESSYLLWFLAVLGIAFYFYIESLRTKSFYILLILTLYTFVALSYVVIQVLFKTLNADLSGVYLAFLYFIAAGIALIIFLIRMNKKIKTI